MDNSKEAYDYSKGVSAASYKHPTLSIVRCLLLNGRNHIIQNWDLKCLSASLLVMKNFTRDDGYSTPNINEIAHDTGILKKVTSLSEEKGNALIIDYLEWCRNIINQEDLFLSSFRIQFYRMFKALNLIEASIFLNSINTTFYGNPLDQNILDSIKTGAKHPLTFILQFVCDGHLCDAESLNKIKQQKVQGISINTEDYLSHISSNDIPSPPENVHKKLFPIVSGISVSRGECLIINQTFKNDDERRRFGTEKDEEELIKSMEKIGCKHRIKTERDLRKSGILKSIAQFQQQIKESVPEFIVVVILSHGRQNPNTGADEIMDIDMNGIPLAKIYDSFINGKKCPIMIGKPKLFFIQACRGKEEQVESCGVHRY